MSKMSLFPVYRNDMDPPTLEVVIDELQLTHKALAQRLDVDTKTISRWINGHVPIPGSVALLLRVAVDLQRFRHEH